MVRYTWLLAVLIPFFQMTLAHAQPVPVAVDAEPLFSYDAGLPADKIAIISDLLGIPCLVLHNGSSLQVLRADADMQDGYRKLDMPEATNAVVAFKAFNVLDTVWEIYYITSNIYGGSDVNRLFFDTSNNLAIDEQPLNVDYRSDSVLRMSVVRKALWQHYLILECATRSLVYESQATGSNRRYLQYMLQPAEPTDTLELVFSPWPDNQALLASIDTLKHSVVIYSLADAVSLYLGNLDLAAAYQNAFFLTNPADESSLLVVNTASGARLIRVGNDSQLFMVSIDRNIDPEAYLLLGPDSLLTLDGQQVAVYENEFSWNSSTIDLYDGGLGPVRYALDLALKRRLSELLSDELWPTVQAFDAEFKQLLDLPLAGLAAALGTNSYTPERNPLPTFIQDSLAAAIPAASFLSGLVWLEDAAVCYITDSITGSVLQSGRIFNGEQQRWALIRQESTTGSGRFFCILDTAGRLFLYATPTTGAQE